MLCYLAGAMSYWDNKHHFENATSWRVHAALYLNDVKVKCFDPCMNYSVNKTYDSKGVVKQNLSYLRKTDIVLINLEELDKSPGSMYELFWASFNNIPVIAFGDNYMYGTQPHITEAISIKFIELDDSIEYIQSMYSQNNC